MYSPIIVRVLLAMVRAGAFVGSAVVLLVLSAPPASAMPEFARRYNLSCAACHSAFPRLNKFGEHFANNNMRLPNWKETADQLGDSRLALPDHVPIAVRAQAYVQARQARPSIPSPAQADTRQRTSSRPTWSSSCPVRR